MARPLNVKVGDVFANLRVVVEPFIPEGKHYKYCWCECVLCKKKKLIRASELKNMKYGCVCDKPTPPSLSKPKKIKNMSFEEWCIQNHKQDVLDRWDYDLNKYLPDQISFKSNYKIYFKCPEGKHKSKHISLASISNGGNQLRCDECYLEENSFGAWCNANRPELLVLWDYDLNDVSPYDISFGSNEKRYFKCSRGIHESHLQELSKLTGRSDDIVCSKCNSIAQFIIDNYGENGLYAVWDYEKNVCDPWATARHAKKHIYVKCINSLEHDSYPILCSNFVKGKGCPACRQEREESKLQEKVRVYIEKKYKYSILHEYACTLKAINPKTNYMLPYDNQVNVSDNINLIIEVHGIQHYEVNGLVKLTAEKRGITPQQALAEIQWRDEYKKQYALSQGYHYLAIPYWTEQDESYKTLIDEKIHQILNNTKLINT